MLDEIIKKIMETAEKDGMTKEKCIESIMVNFAKACSMTENMSLEMVVATDGKISNSFAVALLRFEDVKEKLKAAIIENLGEQAIKDAIDRLEKQNADEKKKTADEMAAEIRNVKLN